MELEERLIDAGLSPKEAATYLAILQLGSSTIKPIADRAKIKRTSIYNFIDHLVELGLVSCAVVRGRTQYRALPPERLLELQQVRLRRLEEALPFFNGMFNRSAKKPRISYFEGPEQVRRIVEEEPRCKRETCYIFTGRDMMDMVGGAKFFTEIDRARIKKGVWVRTVRFRHKDVPLPTSASGAKFLRELRYGPMNMEFPMGVGIYDTGKVGFFSSSKERWGILVESAEMTTLMKNLWTLLWERSTPARPGEG
jgi:sugar-specific transcriptional regulator TrmB